MRYILSVIQHVLLGKLAIRHAIYALRIKPVAVTEARGGHGLSTQNGTR